MDENKLTESHLTSAAAFVEGGIQDACDDACSICLEAFCDSNPSSVTSCKHGFHLQCILEWCQRSSQCPMCWQPISLKDPTSQELLEAVEHEKKLRFNPPRTGTIFHHPAFGEFELQNLPVGASDAELEERIIQHLAAAAMGRSHYMARREGQRSRSTAQGRSQFLVFSNSPNASPTSPVSSSPVQGGAENEPAPATSINQSVPLSSMGEEPSQGSPQLLPTDIEQNVPLPSGSSVHVYNQSRISTHNRNSAGQSSPINQDRAGPSDFQSLSESLKSRFSAFSTRYKESLSKSTRGWKEKLFSRNTSTTDLGSEVNTEVNVGLASVSRLMEHHDTRENGGDIGCSPSNNDSDNEPDSQRSAAIRASSTLNDGNTSPACVASSGQQ